MCRRFQLTRFIDPELLYGLFILAVVWVNLGGKAESAWTVDRVAQILPAKKAYSARESIFEKKHILLASIIWCGLLMSNISTKH